MTDNPYGPPTTSAEVNHVARRRPRLRSTIALGVTAAAVFAVVFAGLSEWRTLVGAESCATEAQKVLQQAQHYLRGQVGIVQSESAEVCDSTAGVVVRLESSAATVEIVASRLQASGCVGVLKDDSFACVIRLSSAQELRVDVYVEDGLLQVIGSSDL